MLCLDIENISNETWVQLYPYVTELQQYDIKSKSKAAFALANLVIKLGEYLQNKYGVPKQKGSQLKMKKSTSPIKQQ